MAKLGSTNYGKQRVRLVRVVRHADRHELADLTVGVRFFGAYRAAHADGDNRAVLPTDTMKNTVYAFAKQHPVTPIEEFGLILARHFLEAGAGAAEAVEVEIASHPWTRLDVDGAPHAHAFEGAGGGARAAKLHATREGTACSAGITGLVLLKTTGSGFEGYPRDRYTTLKETTDRIFATAVTASWRYARAEGLPFDELWARARQALTATFAGHDSKSVQHTLYAMGEAALAAVPEMTKITLSLPNRHHLLVDLSPFGLTNDNEVFVATEEPHGLIEATVRRDPTREP